MKTRTKTSRRAHPASIEPLESRQYFALYLHDVDSLNLGKGMFAWDLPSSMSNDGFSSGQYTQWFNYLKNTMHLNYLITKAGDGASVYPSTGAQYTAAVVNAAHAAGIKIFPYFFIYGDNVAGEASIFNSVFSSGGVGGDGAVLDIEGYDGGASGLTTYFADIHRSSADYGTGSLANDKMFMAYSTYDTINGHSGPPYSVLGDYMDAAMPQMYWKAHGGMYTISYDFASVVDTYFRSTSSTFMGATANIKPVIPTGQAYDSGSGLPSASEEASYFSYLKTDTNAVGPGGVNGSSYYYKSVNYFDEHTLDSSLRSEIAGESIGDLPGAATLTTPANNAHVASITNITLDWSDVVNTFGPGSVGAALYYDVYVDGALKTTVSYSAPTPPASTTTVNVTTGTHTWYVIARDMFGSGTQSSTFTFTAGGSLPGSFTNVSPANGAVQNIRPVTFDWGDSSSATSYDLYVGSSAVATGLTSSTWTGLASGLNQIYSWHVVANNSSGRFTVPTWSVTVDVSPPTAALGTQNPLTGNPFLDFTVTFTDATAGVDVSTLDSNDITVSGPNGYAANATFVSVDNPANGSPRVATYRIAAPGGFWNDADDGSYTVTQVANQVRDVAGNARAAGTIGTLNVTGLGTAWMSGSILNVAFDGTATPLLLSTSAGNIAVTKNSTTTTFAGVTSISVIGSSADDRLQINAPLTPPLSFVDSAGNDLLEVDSGTYTFGSDIGTPSRNLAVYIASGAAATFNASQHLRSLSVDGTATFTSNGSNVLWLTNLAVTGQLDLGDNDMIWDYSATSPIGAWATTAYTGLTGLITSGRNGGTWNGNGLITTQSSALGGNPLTTLGIAEASDALNLQPGQTAAFDGQTVDATAVLVKYTYTGDANLNGHIDGDDYFSIDNNYESNVPSPFHGDFDMNGRMDADDYFLIDSNYVRQGTFL